MIKYKYEREQIQSEHLSVEQLSCALNNLKHSN